MRYASPRNHNNIVHVLLNIESNPMWNDSIEHHDIGNRSKHQSRGICFRTLFEPICMGRHRPDIANQRSFRDGDTTRYASPRAVKMISTFYH